MKNSLIILIAVFSLMGCEKLTNEVESFDLFGLEQAQDAIDENNEKIQASRKYQEKFLSEKERKKKQRERQLNDPYTNPNILGEY